MEKGHKVKLPDRKLRKALSGWLGIQTGKREMEIVLKKKNMRERRLHYGMAAIGGFLGGFAILIHHSLFANAQTTNLISLAISIVGRNPLQILLHMGSLFLYMLGLSLTVLIPRYTKWNVRLLSIVIDALALLSLPWIPHAVDDFVAMYPIFFAMAFQWNSFQGADGYNSSSIFSTNNLRQFTTSITEYFCDGDRNHLHKSSFYGGTLLFFHMGVAGSYFACTALGEMGALLGLIPVGAALYFLFAEKHSLGKRLVAIGHKAA